jgi:hypothetical protein
VTFNNQSNAARIRLVLLAIGFANSLAAPTTTARTVSVRLTDGVGGTSVLQSKLVNVVSVNEAPQLTNLGGAVNFTRSGPAVLLASAATITDTDTPVFTGGQLRFHNTNGLAVDLLSIRTSSSLTVSAGNVSYNGSVFGTVSGGTGTTALVISFNAQASLARVQLLLRSIQFSSTTSTASTTPRSISVTLEDGFGGQTPLQTKLVNIL